MNNLIFPENHHCMMMGNSKPVIFGTRRYWVNQSRKDKLNSIVSFDNTSNAEYWLEAFYDHDGLLIGYAELYEDTVSNALKLSHSHGNISKIKELYSL